MDETLRKFGPYKLIKKIGRGAFGVVWLAEKQTAITATQVALKLPRDEDIDIEAFKQEAAIWVQASGHENVVSLIEADIYDEQVAIVSEYVPDGSLTSWLKHYGGRAPSIESAGRMIAGVLAGLSHLHERRIIHRDLKPDNILLRRETPLLADFGIARLLRSGSHSMNISGTLAYMAPEAFDGKRTEQTDIWAVGVIFYQLLSGQLPYPQQDHTAFIGAIMRHDPPSLPDSVPEVFRGIVSHALQRDPEQRYASAAQMRGALLDAERQLWLKDHRARETSEANEKAADGPTAIQYPATITPTNSIAEQPATVAWLEPQTNDGSHAATRGPAQPTLRVDPKLFGDFSPQLINPPKQEERRFPIWLFAGLGIVLLGIILGIGAYQSRSSPDPSRVANLKSPESPSQTVTPAKTSPSADVKIGGRDAAPRAPSDPNAVGNASKPTGVNSPPVGEPTDYTRVFGPTEVSQQARVLSKPTPGYTEEARKNAVTGTVVLKAILTSSGEVTSVQAVKTLPYGLTEKAIAAAQGIRFTPAQKDGHLVSQYVQLEYLFSPYGVPASK